MKNVLMNKTVQELQDELDDCEPNSLKFRAIKHILEIKKNKNNKTKSKTHNTKDTSNTKDTFDITGTFDITDIMKEEFPLREDDFEDTEDDIEMDYDPILLNEVKKDSINNRVMSRMNSDIIIKNANKKRKRRRIETPYVDYRDSQYANPFDEGLDPYDFSNRRFLR